MNFYLEWTSLKFGSHGHGYSMFEVNGFRVWPGKLIRAHFITLILLFRLFGKPMLDLVTFVVEPVDSGSWRDGESPFSCHYYFSLFFLFLLNNFFFFFALWSSVSRDAKFDPCLCIPSWLEIPACLSIFSVYFVAFNSSSRDSSTQLFLHPSIKFLRNFFHNKWLILSQTFEVLRKCSLVEF